MNLGLESQDSRHDVSAFFSLFALFVSPKGNPNTILWNKEKPDNINYIFTSIAKG